MKKIHVRFSAKLGGYVYINPLTNLIEVKKDINMIIVQFIGREIVNVTPSNDNDDVI